MYFKDVVNGIKKYAKIGIVSGVSVLPFASGCTTKSDYEYKPQITVQLPEKLTQQTEDFYKNPNKEFEIYSKTYFELAKDGVIDSKDVENLEHILTKTLEEIEKKISESKEKIDFTSLSNYLAFCNKMRNDDLKELRKHLEYKKAWMPWHLESEKYWNYGVLAVESEGNIEATETSAKNGYVGLKKLFEQNMHNNYTTVSNLPKILRLDEEFPIKNKLPSELGVFIDFAGVGIAYLLYSALSSKRRREPIDLGIDDIFFGGFLLSVMSALTGILTTPLNYMHPSAFPIKVGLLAAPSIYECGKILQNKYRTYVENRRRQEALEEMKDDEKEEEIIFDTTEETSLILEEEEILPIFEQPEEDEIIFENRLDNPTTPIQFEGESQRSFQERVDNYWHNELQKNEKTYTGENKKEPEKQQKQPEKKKTILNGKELTEAEQDAFNDIVIRFKHLELD